MSRDLRPSYWFDFIGGVATAGTVKRTFQTIVQRQIHWINYSIDDLPLVAGLGKPLSVDSADLLDVSTAIFVADRLAKRETEFDPRPPQDRWHRRIHVRLPLRRPEIWKVPEVIALLEALIGSLSDDVGTFEFGSRSLNPRPSEAQVGYLRLVEGPLAVAPLSGGLDSMLGLIHLMSRPTAEVVAPVTVVTNDRVLAAATAVVEHLKSAREVSDADFLPLRMHVQVCRSGRSRDDREASQRARAMLFLAAVVAAASTAGVNRVQITENGVGAIGLPMTADHWGSHATKATHPRTLTLFSDLASLVLEQPVTIENSGLFFTKGELARALIGGRFATAAQLTVSCDRVAYLSPGKACGRCSSCILRRVALVAAGIDRDIDGPAVAYETDWLNPATRLAGDEGLQLFAMRDQVERMRAALSSEGFTGLEQAFPDLFDVVVLAPRLGLTKLDVERSLTRLFESYVREFDAFLARIDRPGWGSQNAIVDMPVPENIAAAG